MMKKVTKTILQDAASRLMFSLSDEQLDVLLNEFEILTQQMELIGQLEGVDQLAPMTFPFEVTVESMRIDEPSVPLTQTEALANASSKVAGQIKLPKVV
jgi:aspartyl/glutamyl-tRNA(Asn/Gln) amidotransferase C subunit